MTTGALQPRQHIERFEKIAGDGGVVAQIYLPLFRRHDQEARADGSVHIEMFGAVFDQLARHIAMCVSGGIQHACLDATRTQAAPVSLGEAEYKCLLDRVGRLQRFTEAAEDFVVLALVLFGKDDERG
jgi:hypothetical protein